MSIGNLNTQGDKKNNFPYQLAVLKLLDAILAATGGGGGGCCPPELTTPSLLRISAPGNVPAGARSVTIYNGGAVNGLVLGAIIKPGESMTWGAELNNTLSIIAYDGTGTELVITTVV
jgi:hypothetical protein